MESQNLRGRQSGERSGSVSRDTRDRKARWTGPLSGTSVSAFPRDTDGPLPLSPSKTPAFPLAVLEEDQLRSRLHQLLPMRKSLVLLCLATSVFLTACRTPWGEPRSLLQRDTWEHKGVIYPSSSEYLEARRRDQFATTYPLTARLDDFRSYDDMRLGLYYFHHVNRAGANGSPLSAETMAELLQALQERGVGRQWIPLIEAGNVRIGMPLAGLYASWGSPWNGYRSQTREGETIQHIYRGEDLTQRHIFTVNGIVTTWKE